MPCTCTLISTSLAEFDKLLLGEDLAAEEEAAYKVTPMVTPEEQQYLEKLLEVLRNPATKKAIQENIDTFLKVPKPAMEEDIPFVQEKKEGRALSGLLDKRPCPGLYL